MKTVTLSVAIGFMLLLSNGWAQQSPSPSDDPANQSAGAEAGLTERQELLDNLITQLSEEMEIIRNTEDRAERERLMAIHHETMREAMELVRDMGGVHMRTVMAEHMAPHLETPAEPDNRPRHRHKKPPVAPPRPQISMSQRVEDLENRVDMMQVIIESLLDQQSE